MIIKTPTTGEGFDYLFKFKFTKKDGCIREVFCNTEKDFIIMKIKTELSPGCKIID
jgi:hypothetical protein